LQRKAALQEKASQRPGPDAEDVADVTAVERASKNMGDYKLKSAADYEVPVEKQVDATKKKRQMVLLEDSIYNIRMKFNKRFLALRSLKKGLDDRCRFVLSRYTLYQ
jgi:hypothetical protein